MLLDEALWKTAQNKTLRGMEVERIKGRVGDSPDLSEPPEKVKKPKVTNEMIYEKLEVLSKRLDLIFGNAVLINGRFINITKGHIRILFKGLF